MRKKNFCLAVLSASAVLALGASFSSFAAWKSVNSEWVYTDNNGNNVTSAWRSDNGESTISALTDIWSATHFLRTTETTTT
ncbi:MAG: hypothetical protein V8S37_06830 [Lachnospiraceae bacterium]